MDNLMQYRLDNAKEKLESAKVLLDAEEQYNKAVEFYNEIHTYLLQLNS